MKIKLEIFEGPLDLLLYLVKRDHLNIYDIPISRVTEQYLQYLELMRLLDLNIASEFLVMAATLLEIKSKMLLPQEIKEEITEEEQIDPREELVKRLLEYKKFKEAAQKLKEKELERQKHFLRPMEVENKEEFFFEANIFDLLTAFSNALKEIPKELFYEVIKDEFTVEEKIHQILHLLLVEPIISLNELFQKAKNKLEIVAIFLAVLELIRLREIRMMQNKPFGEIKIERHKEHIMGSFHGK